MKPLHLAAYDRFEMVSEILECSKFPREELNKKCKIQYCLKLPPLGYIKGAPTLLLLLD